DCDVDMDGFQGTACGGPDCDDSDASIYPGAAELCNGKDDNCDTVVDEGCACEPGTLRDCWPDDTTKFPTAARHVGICRDGWQQCQLSGTWSDCKDAVGPDKEAVTCDGKDHNCDGVLDAHDPKNPAVCVACKSGSAEICGDGLDNDCDGH